MTASRSPIDWARAERVATWVAQRRAAPVVAVDAAVLSEMAAIAQERVAELTGLRPPTTPAEVRVVDRPEWIRSNLASFQTLLEPLFERLEQRTTRHPRARRVTAQVAGAELGGLLGAMSARVLGQYDLLVQRDTGDAVYLVGPNLALIEQRYGFPPDEFRMWVLLHELTHRAQFTGVPWMRAHFTGLIDQSLSLVDPDPQAVFSALREGLRDRDEARERVRDGGVLSLIASPEQRALMRRLGGMMSLLEGHGEVTMDRAAVDLVPSAPRFGEVLRARRRRGSPLGRLVQRLVGLDAKLEQYAAGERFVAALESTGGRAMVDRCWVTADNLPTLDEIRDPPLWLARMGTMVA
jgi:coenzyme F420 biosynthesis associated uncharacterized protein